MSFTDLRASGAAVDLPASHGLVRIPGGVFAISVTETLTLSGRHPHRVKLIPTAARTVVLDAEETSDGLRRFLYNAATSAYNITVTNDAPATIATLRAGESAWFACDGTSWVLDGAVIPSAHPIPGASTTALGTNAATAAALPAGTSTIYPVAAADDTVGVIIHANDQVTGRTLFIGNNVSNKILKVYGPTGAVINGAAADAAFSSASGKSVLITCLSGSGNTWMALG